MSKRLKYTKDILTSMLNNNKNKNKKKSVNEDEEQDDME